MFKNQDKQNNICFIRTANGYEQIPYAELCKRRNTIEEYKSKKFLPLHGMLMEVTEETYRDFYRDRRRQKYIDERSAENNDFSYDMLTTDDFNGEDILIDTSQEIDEAVISRFARNTVDCLENTRLLKELGVDVFFEEQGIHSTDPGAEFYITIYGSIAQSESENISANVKWGKAQSAKEGNVPFQYKRFLGYRKGADGKPEIDPEQAETVKRIYGRFLSGDSLAKIADDLNTDGVPTPSGKGSWLRGTIQSILTNEKYKGDAVLNKTYISDCLTKKVKINNGERPKYYVENNHPAIIDSATFGRVQEEMARRSSKRKVKQVGTKTEQGKYSGKYALTELLICGECGTPYRRCTWSKNGKKKIVWRCISRLDYGKKYCKDSPSIEESILHNVIAEAITQKAQMENADVARIRKHIEMYQSSQDTSSILAKQERLKTIREHINQLTDMDSEAAQNGDFDAQFKSLYAEMYAIKDELDEIEKSKSKIETVTDSIEEMTVVMQGLKNHPVEYNDLVVRQLIECIKVMSKDTLHIYFKDGMKMEAHI